MKYETPEHDTVHLVAPAPPSGERGRKREADSRVSQPFLGKLEPMARVSPIHVTARVVRCDVTVGDAGRVVDTVEPPLSLRDLSVDLNASGCSDCARAD